MARLLIVEDEPDLRFLIRLVFEQAGHDVVEAGHGASALESIAASLPDLVVTDIMMPVMDGIELISRLRSEASTATIPILVVSGNGDLSVGADATLRKPFQPKELVMIATALLRAQSQIV